MRVQNEHLKCNSSFWSITIVLVFIVFWFFHFLINLSRTFRSHFYFSGSNFWNKVETFSEWHKVWRGQEGQQITLFHNSLILKVPISEKMIFLALIILDSTQIDTKFKWTENSFVLIVCEISQKQKSIKMAARVRISGRPH